MYLLLRRRTRLDAGARAVAAVIAAATPAASFPTAAQAFTTQQCTVIQGAFSDYIRGNIAHFSDADKAELLRLNGWIRGGCQGNITLRSSREVSAALVSIQTQLNRMPTPDLRVQLAGRVTLD